MFSRSGSTQFGVLHVGVVYSVWFFHLGNWYLHLEDAFYAEQEVVLL